MKGKFLHNTVIAATLVKALRLRGYRVHLEHPVHHGQRPRAVDIFFRVCGRPVAMEIECDNDRLSNDIAKARLLNADTFVIVTPTASAARSARSTLDRLARAEASAIPAIKVMPFGAALQWVANNCPLMSACNVTNDF